MAQNTRVPISRQDLGLFDGNNPTFRRLSNTGGIDTVLAIGGDVDILTVYGEGSDRSEKTIQKAINAVGSSAVSFSFAPGSWNIENDISFPDNVFLKPSASAVFNISLGKTMLVYSPEHIIASSAQQIHGNPVTGGTLTFLKKGKVFPEWWGADPSGSDDSTTALELATREGGLLWLQPNATYKVETNIISTLVDIHIEGNNATLDGSSSSIQKLIVLGGIQISATADDLTTTITAGANSFISDITGIEENDIIQITTSTAWQTGLPGAKGELVEVKSTAGTTINLMHPTYDGYTGEAATVITEIFAPKVVVHDLNIVRDSDDIGMEVIYARDIEISNMTIKGARWAGLVIQNVYGGEVRNVYTSDSWFSGTGTSYGISQASSQMVLFDNNRDFDAKHGMTNGGTYVYRDITITNGTYDNRRGLGSQYSLDFHSNGEFITVENNTVWNSIHSSAKNIKINNNRSYATDTSGFFAISFFLHSDADYIEASGNEIFAKSTTAAIGGIAIQLRKADITINKIDLSNNYIESLGHGIRVQPQNDTITGTLIRSLTMNDNIIYAHPATAANIPAIIVGSGDATLTIDNLTIDGGYLSGSDQVILIKTNISRGMTRILNTFMASPDNGTPIFISDGGSPDVFDLIIRGNTIDTGGPSNLIRARGSVIIEGNEVKDALTNDGWDVVAVRDLIFSNNSGEGNLGTLDLTSVQRVLVSKFGKNGIAFLSAAPSEGSWTDGDVIHNTPAASGAASGWRCITSGTFNASASSATGDSSVATGAVVSDLSEADAAKFAIGSYVSVDKGFPATGPYQVLRKTTTSLTLDTNSNGTETDITVSTPDPTFAAMANL